MDYTRFTVPTIFRIVPTISRTARYRYYTLQSIFIYVLYRLYSTVYCTDHIPYCTVPILYFTDNIHLCTVQTIFYSVLYRPYSVLHGTDTILYRQYSFLYCTDYILQCTVPTILLFVRPCPLLYFTNNLSFYLHITRFIIHCKAEKNWPKLIAKYLQFISIRPTDIKRLIQTK